MTAPSHHPSEARLLDLARGALAEGPAAVVAAHVGACPACRAQVRLAEAVGGALLSTIEPAPMAQDALARALAAIEVPSPAAPAAAAQGPEDWIRVPSQILAAARSRRWMAPGVWVAMVDGDRKGGPRSYLLGIGAGIAVPMHTHRGSELLCVVKGAFEDGGRIYRAGDFAESDETISHEPKVTRDGDCVCLVATDDYLVPVSFTAKLFHRFIRI
ncbi:MAG TPA: ChrR family anti-sigma-E factor [Caulobacteraceae bacterium]|nr:ChrR family anti-sigma-E factor [Caulobacteraceae bacterium]